MLEIPCRWKVSDSLREMNSFLSIARNPISIYTLGGVGLCDLASELSKDPFLCLYQASPRSLANEDPFFVLLGSFSTLASGFGMCAYYLATVA